MAAVNQPPPFPSAEALQAAIEKSLTHLHHVVMKWESTEHEEPTIAEIQAALLHLNHVIEPTPQEETSLQTKYAASLQAARAALRHVTPPPPSGGGAAAAPSEPHINELVQRAILSLNHCAEAMIHPEHKTNELANTLVRIKGELHHVEAVHHPAPATLQHLVEDLKAAARALHHVSAPQ